MKPLFYLSLLFIALPWLQSQETATAPRPVINADIVEMSRAGLLPAVLIAKSKQLVGETEPKRSLLFITKARVVVPG